MENMSDNIFDTISGPLVNNPLGKCLEVIRTGTYKAAARDSRWVYELVSDLWPDAELYSEYSGDESGEEGGTDQENPYDHKK